jgi:peptide/nickel transport system substrate-binding protein
MKKTLFILLAFILLSSLMVAACAKSTSESTLTPKTELTPSPDVQKYGGILKTGATSVSPSFGVPWKFRHGDRYSAMMVLEYLIRRGQEPGTYEGRLAETWELAPDKSSYTFHLRKGVKFHDGTDFNAEAVKWNFEKDKEAGLPQFDDVTSIDVVDTYTVRINISEWNSEFLHNFATDTDCAMIISPTAFEKNGEEWANTHPVGTGPFKLKDYKANQYVYFEKNPDYWEKGIPYLDEVRIDVVPDMVTFMAALKAGDLDGGGVDFLTASELQKTGDFNVWVNFGNLGSALSYNMKDPNSVWSDKRMREALEYAIDKEKICRTLTYGFCEPTYEIIRGIHGAGDPGTIPRKYDPAKAKQLMAEAGHPTLSGINLEYSIMDKSSYQDAYLAIQKNLADVGIQVELKPIEPATFNQISFQPTNGNDLRIETVRGDPIFPLVRVKEDLAVNTIYFPGATRPEGFQELLDKALATEDRSTVIDLCMQMERLAYDHIMYVSLWSRPMLSAMNPKVHDADAAYGQVPYPYYERAWIEK